MKKKSNKMPFVLALTGGIASGKSMVSEILKDEGAYIIDTDLLSREVTMPGGAGEARLKELFPEAFLNGAMDRAALRRAVFADEEKRAALNAAVHPLIGELLDERLSQSSARVAVVVVPLLFETGMDRIADFVLTVSAPEKIRIERLKKRDNISDELAQNMLRAQMSDEEREARADAAIVNDGSTDVLEKRVRAIYKMILENIS